MRSWKAHWKAFWIALVHRCLDRRCRWGVFTAKKGKKRRFYDQFSGFPHGIVIFFGGHFLKKGKPLKPVAWCTKWWGELYQKGAWIFTEVIIRNELRRSCWLFPRQMTMDLCFYDCRWVKTARRNMAKKNLKEHPAASCRSLFIRVNFGVLLEWESIYFQSIYRKWSMDHDVFLDYQGL